MNRKTLQAAMRAAERFLDHAHQVRKEDEDSSTHFITGTRTTGACRRASMDLTRALSDMRKPC